MAHSDNMIPLFFIGFLVCALGIGFIMSVWDDKRAAKYAANYTEQLRQGYIRERAELELSLLPFALTGQCPICRHRGKWKMEICTSFYAAFYHIAPLTYLVTTCKQCGHQLRRRTAEDAPRQRPLETPEQAAQREVDELAPND